MTDMFSVEKSFLKAINSQAVVVYTFIPNTGVAEARGLMAMSLRLARAKWKA